jgi:hypothetical protein
MAIFKAITFFFLFLIAVVVPPLWLVVAAWAVTWVVRNRKPRRVEVPRQPARLPGQMGAL